MMFISSNPKTRATQVSLWSCLGSCPVPEHECLSSPQIQPDGVIYRPVGKLRHKPRAAVLGLPMTSTLKGPESLFPRPAQSSSTKASYSLSWNLIFDLQPPSPTWLLLGLAPLY